MCEKYDREIRQGNTCFTERFMGSQNVSDYDGVDGFHYLCKAEVAKNPFTGYGYRDGVFYARIMWRDKIIYVPPKQAIQKTLY